MRYLTIFILTLCSLTGLLYAQNADVTATAYQTVNVRSGPGTQFDIIGRLSEGDTVPVMGRESDQTRWLYVAIPETELLGWVAVFTVTTSGGLESLTIVTASGDVEDDSGDSEISGVQVIAFGRVNVRSGPGIVFDVQGQLDIEDEAEAIARSNYNNDWLFIENESVDGWVAYFTVTVRGNAEDLPVLIPDAVSGDLVPPSTQIDAAFNVRLHSRADFSSPVTGIIPFGTQVSPLGVTANGRWLYVAYNGSEGWAWAGLFNVTAEQLATIPRRAAPLSPASS
jgi:N-acetylmuramoyl-L-alanine amidase